MHNEENINNFIERFREINNWRITFNSPNSLTFLQQTFGLYSISLKDTISFIIKKKTCCFCIFVFSNSLYIYVGRGILQSDMCVYIIVILPYS